MTDLAPVRRALISVSDKTDLIPFARALEALGIELLSTGGTARTLDEGPRKHGGKYGRGKAEDELVCIHDSTAMFYSQSLTAGSCGALLVAFKSPCSQGTD